MGRIKSNKLMRWLVISILSIAMVLITVKIGMSSVFSDKNSNEGMEQVQANVLPLAGVSDDAIKLKGGEGGNIISITLYYLVGNTWVEVTEENCSNLPADANYQIEIKYQNLSVNDLIEADGQMIFEGIPAWFQFAGVGVIMYGSEVAGHISEVDGKVVLTFDLDWLETHKNQMLNGSFKINGMTDWHELPPDGGVARIPDLDIDLHFEDDLAQKYGIIQIEKSEPELVKYGDEYYLKYEVTVTSSESVSIPDITVKDKFTNTAYIESYIGVDGTIELPDEETDNFSPWEKRGDNLNAGKISMDGTSMLWNIDVLQPGEVRTLTYYAKIAENYIDSVINNPIQNRAEVYSGKKPNGEYLKDVDQNSFTPHNEVKLTKGRPSVNIGPEGNGTISYTITITASEDNSFTLTDLTLNDYFPEDLKDYLSGDGVDGKQITITATTTSADGETEIVTQSVTYDNASFDFNLDLEPGMEMTVTYTVQVKNVFFYNNGDVKLTNTASISKGNRTLSTSKNTETLEKKTWTRKMLGETLDQERKIDMNPFDGIYHYNEGKIEENTSEEKDFTVPAGSLKYQVVLNESGQWDLSSTMMTDTLDSTYLRYTGYIEIQLFDRGGKNSSNLSDADLVKELESSQGQLVKTVWLKVDDAGSFSFKPEDLGLENGEYTYLLTYYAEPTEEAKNVGLTMVTNHFKIEGDVGTGNGTVFLPGIEISVSSVMQGGLKNDAEKFFWYFTPNPEDEDVDLWTDGTKYENGAQYWMIKLEGTIPENYVVRDSRAASNILFCYDSVPIAFRGPKNFDWTEYSSFGDLLNHYDHTELVGNKYNGRWTKEPAPSTDKQSPYYDYYDYWWTLGDNGTSGPFTLTFQKEIDLKDNEAIYIIVRTNPSAHQSTITTAETYRNELSINSDGNGFVPINSDEYTYIAKTSLFKESKGAYIYNKDEQTFTNCSDRTNGDWKISNINTELLPSSGIYATWLLNVNWDGSMDGTADIIDYLPEGMELVYVDVNNFGKYAKNKYDRWPSTEYIPELSNSAAWQEMSQDGLTTSNQLVTTISYYNPDTREIRWRISNLTTGGYKDYEINLRIICKVTDYELFLSGQGKNYVNQAAVIDPVTEEPVDMESADVTIVLNIDKNLDEETLKILQATVSGNNITGRYNELPFKININPLCEDMCEGDVLPALIDELSPGMLLIENSLKIVLDDGTPYTNFTHTVKQENGQQILIIEGLPDETPLTIQYSIRVDAKPQDVVNISNKAYWAGNPAPDKPQVDDKTFSYDPSGDVDTADITVNITKVDADFHSKKLKGGEFALYEVNLDGSLIEPAVRTGTTDSDGKIKFGNQDTSKILKLNTVYCICELMAPNGYIATNDKHYFAIVTAVDGKYDDFAKYNIDNLELWYDGPNYSHVIENSKEPITVEKIFEDINGNPYTPVAGKYRFGLYDTNHKLLETLTIEYLKNGERKYYLDDMETDSPHFVKYDPESMYYIYELDDVGSIIQNGIITTINGKNYFVSYEVADASTNQVTTGSNIVITNMPTGDLTVKKTVSGTYGEKEKYFKFTVTLITPGTDDEPFAAINGEYGDMTFVDGVAEFTLKHGESVTAKGLPAGIAYIVQETEDKNYDVTWAKTVGGTVVSSSEGTKPEDHAGTITSETEDVVTAVNTRGKGSVTISKTVTGFGEGETVADNEGFEFTITIKEADGSTIQGEFAYTVGKTGTTTPGEGSSSESLSVKSGGKITLKPGEYATIAGLPSGAVVTVTETTTGYAFEYTASYTVDNEKETNGSTASVTVDKLDATNAQAKGNEIHFVNTVKSSKLEITKATVGQKASVSDTEEFEFTVKLTSDNGTALTGDYYYDVTDKGGKNVSSKNPLVKTKTLGEYTFKLKTGQTVTILGLPVGAKYEVTENDNDRYSAQYGEGNSDNISGVIVAGKTQSGTVTNTYQFGDLTVKKKVDAGTVGELDPNASFVFTITLTPPAGGTLASNYSCIKSKGSNEDAKEAALLLQEKEDGTFVGSFSLLDGESITILDLPIGTTYSVEETVPNNYEAKYSAEGVTNADLPCSGKIETPGKNIEVTVTNKRLKPALAVEKKVSLDGKNFKDNLVVDLEDILTYQIVVTSNGDGGSVYENVVLEDVLDTDFELIENSFTCVDKDGKDVPVTPDYDKGANKIEWSLGDMPKGMEITITYQIRFLNTGNALSKNYKNIAIVQGDRDEVIVSNDPGQLIITKTVENSRGEVLENDTTKFTFTVTLTPPEDIKLSSGYPCTVTDQSGNVVRQGTFAVDEETGEGTIELAQGEMVSISKLPTGTIYQVVESENPDYTKKSEEHVTGTIGSKTDATLNVVAFVNVRKPVKTEIDITKILIGVLPEGSEYTFAFRATLKTIDGKAVNETNGKTLQSSVTIEADDQQIEENVRERKAVLATDLDEGVYEFVIEELDSQIDEIAYDTEKYTVTITVASNAKGELEASITKITDEKGANLPTDQEIVFNNKYKYSPFDVDVELNKNLVGAKLKGEDFTFDYTVEYAKTKSDAFRLVTIGTATNDKDGKINLKLTFDQPGIYTLTVKEDSTKGGPYQYSNNVYKVEYTVTYNDETGKMEYTTKVLSGSDTFANKYVTDPVVVEIPITKKLTGNLPKGSEYTFAFQATLKTINGKEVDETNAKMIHSSVTIKDTDQLEEGNIRIAKAVLSTELDEGVYEFEVEELDSQIDEISYDTKKYTVTVTVVSDDEGELEAEITKITDGKGMELPKDQSIVFENKYKYDPFDVDVEMNKVLEGAKLKGKDFTFDYTVEYAKTKDTPAQPVTNGTVTNDKDGKISLKLTFDQPGIYTLTVQEDSTKGGPYQYSENIYKVAYTVTYNDETGKMEYTSNVLSGSDTFTNKYVTDPAVIEIPVTKNLKGKLPEDGIYTIVFKATRISIDGVEIPVKNSIVSSVTIKGPSDDNKTGKTIFGITCDKAGKYVYQIEELKPADENISHDEIIYFVTIDVTDNGTGRLVYELSVEDSSGKLIDEDGIVFDNMYTQEQDTEEPTTNEEETTEDTEEPTTSEEETTEDTEEPTTQEEVTTEDTEEPTTREEETTEDTEEPTTQEEVTTEDTEEPTTQEEVTTEDTEEPTTREEVTTEDTEEPTTHEEVTTEDTEEPTTHEEVTTEDTEEPTSEEVTTEDTEEPTTREEATTEDTEDPTTSEEVTTEDTEEPTTNVIEAGDSAPKTGDSQMTGMCFLMMLFSLSGACIVYIRRQKKI